ncbi:D-2-hydroxyacid dehydrogenase [Bradyrhizobium jicamae]|uniref:D-2-hydroxyacid dehydrogenase n=1 Tax=Bradyrhizobium jicamae TaxID=280332 RepID=UPI001BA5A5BC|nr:D-2-hydroxyacid dehydrogenase [Bradyrhizobium jicamae]MBR0755251.1 D-2-hydroxyacid dehydrogenase [Bradyrhizobium jicamae]
MAEAGLEVVLITEDVSGLAEGIVRACPTVRLHTGSVASDVLDRAGKANVVIGLAQTITPELVAATPQLRWIQALTTGIDPLLKLSLSKEVIVTSARGVHGPQMSEMAFMHMLALARDLPRMIGNQRHQKWERWPQRLLLGKTMVAVGVGAISEELARRCKAFGMRVIGISDARTTGEGFDEIRSRRELVATAAEADFLVVMAAYTPQTRHLINTDVLAALPSRAYVINLARGPVVDEAALIAGLKARSFAGAGLDVFDVEPLSVESPLWNLDNVLITPHLGGMSDSYSQQLLPLVVHNLRAFAAGEIDQMHNRISIAATGAGA